MLVDMHAFFRRTASSTNSASNESHLGAAVADTPRTVRFTNCRLARDHGLICGEDLWVRDGVIANPKQLFWEGAQADEVVDCGGKILAPGLIELQLNGGWGADFSTPGPALAPGLRRVARQLLAHGVTSFLPTVVTSSPEAYRAILPDLVPIVLSDTVTR